MDKKELGAEPTNNSDSFWNLSSEFSQDAKEKKLKKFSDDTEAVLINVGEENKCEISEKSCIVSDDDFAGEGKNLAKSENTPGLETNADNADNMYKNSEISDTDAGNEERYELEKLLLRLRERAKRNTSEQASCGSREKHGSSEYNVSVPHFHTPSQTGLIRSYQPGHPLVRSVEVLEWPSRYSFYERFRQDAVRYFEAEGTECEYADFNSFVPQYCMMTENQRRYYIWWRTCIRNGRYIYASKSYILLLLYEIINLPDLLPPNEGVRIICRLICGYHVKLCGIRNSVAVWLRDYCLIHEVEIPPEYMERIAEYAGKYTSFSEFFVKYDPETKLPDPQSYIQLLSRYSWWDSKYLSGENRHIFDKCMQNALTAAYCSENCDGMFDLSHMQTGKYIAESYSGAVCTSEVKCRLRVSYYKCTGSGDYHYATEIVKYAENQVRRLIGVKARFKVQDLPKRISDAIDAYFEPLLEKEDQRRKLEKRSRLSTQEISPEYSKFYEAESTGISFEHALEIEKKSWEITEKLVEAFDDTDIRSGGYEKRNVENMPNSDFGHAERADIQLSFDSGGKDVYDGSDDVLRCGIEFLLRGDKIGFAGLAKSEKMLPDTLAEKINDRFAVLIGDIILQPDSDSYTVIDDYRDDAESFVSGTLIT